MFVEQNFFIEGCLYGLGAPSLQLLVNLEGARPRDCIAAWCDLSAYVDIPGFPDDPTKYAHTENGLGHCVIDMVRTFYQHVRMPLRKRGLIVDLGDEGGAGRVAIQVPVLATSASQVAEIVNWLLHSAFQSPQDLDVGHLRELLGRLEQSMPGGSTGTHFMNAALDKSIPFEWLADHVVQFGQGRRARRLDGTFTDQTSRIATLLARDKLATSRLLRQSGLPVAHSLPAFDVSSALHAAEHIGYPVVVKAADLDGGIGVAGQVLNDAELTEAVAFCLKQSPNLMVEKFVPGRDYRLVVHRGQLLWTVERVPGGVTGDGLQTVRELLDVYNAHPLRGTAQHLPLKPIELDDEANGLMACAGVSPSCILPDGQFLRLRKAANIARGGMVRAAQDDVHPDNRLLAERAASAIGVDLAGIDLLIPDIAVSWMEGGAAICEVNAQPDLGFLTSAHLYPELLSRLVQGNGRIPIIVLVGAGRDHPLAKSVAAVFQGLGVCVGMSDDQGVSIGGRAVTASSRSPFDGGRILVRDSNVGCIILCLDDLSVLNEGLAFDLFDVLVIVGPIGQNGGHPPAALLRAIAPMCRLTLVAESLAGQLDQLRQLGARNPKTLPDDAAQAAAQILSNFRVHANAPAEIA